jgi:hypothetical protein
MATVLEMFTSEEQPPVVRFLWAKGLNAKGIHEEIFPVYGGKCFFRVKRFTIGSRNSLKDIRKSQMIPDQVQKWLRQQSKDFYSAGFDAVVKRWDKCINVCGGYVMKYVFPRFEHHVIYVLYPFVTCLLALPRIRV